MKGARFLLVENYLKNDIRDVGSTANFDDFFYFADFFILRFFFDSF